MSFSISIEPQELQRFNKSMDKYSKDVQKGVQNEVQRAVINIERNAKLNVKKNDLLGTRMAVAAGIVRNIFNRGFSGNVKSTHKAAVYIEQGTKPHIIKAKNKSYLVFKTGSSGSLKTGKFTGWDWVRTKSVNHPGTRAEPYLFPAAEKEQDSFINRLRKIL